MSHMCRESRACRSTRWWLAPPPMAARARASSPGTGTTRSGRSLALDMLDIEPPPDMPLDIEPPPVGPVPDSDPRRRHGGQVADVHEGATDIGGAQAERT